MTEKIQIYGDSKSGNCYKIQLLCAHLNIDYEWFEVDIMAGDTHTPEFLKLNANGKIPLLRLADGRCLSESNAILAYLATDTELAGIDRYAIADVLRWMFFEQYSHEPNIATSRFIIQYLGNPADRQDALKEKSAGGYKALDVMEGRLLAGPYMTGDSFTLADIAL
jgi:glutathione S-transferase